MKPSEKITNYIKNRGGTIRSRQILGILDFLDEEHEINKIEIAKLIDKLKAKIK